MNPTSKPLPKWIIAISGLDQVGFYIHSAYATEAQARKALPHVSEEQVDTYNQLIITNPNLTTPQTQIACWNHHTNPQPGDQITLHNTSPSVATPSAPLDYAGEQYGILYLQNEDQEYTAAACITYHDHADEYLNQLSKLGPNWTQDSTVTLLVDNPAPIQAGDIVEICQLDSTISTYQYDGTQFLNVSFNIRHQSESKEHRITQETAPQIHSLQDSKKQHKPKL